MSARSSTGVMLIVSGWVGLSVGLFISFSLVGAFCGIPMMIACVPLIIWGHIMKAKDQVIRDEQFNERMLQTQAAATGVNLCPMCSQANQNTNPVCGSCGYEFTPIGEPSPISAVDPTESAHLGKSIERVKRSGLDREEEPVDSS